MNKLDDKQTLNIFPGDNSKKELEEIFRLFVQTYFFQKLPTHEVEDLVTNYSSCMIFITTPLLIMKDTTAEGDGDRNFINQKMLLSRFSSALHKSRRY